jgi:hypothetical protein
MVDRKALLFRINGNPDIFIIKLSRHGKLLTENIQYPVTPDKPDQVNIPRGYTKPGRDLKILGCFRSPVNFSRGVLPSRVLYLWFLLWKLSNPLAWEMTWLKLLKYWDLKKDLSKTSWNFSIIQFLQGSAMGIKTGWMPM